MGLSSSWIAVRGRSREGLVAELGLIDTGVVTDEFRVRNAIAELPGGWILIYANDLEFAGPRRVAEWSSGGAALGCLIEEHVMFSGARYFEGGSEKWWVLHDAEQGIYDLSYGGDMPAEFESIRTRLKDQQDAEGGVEAGVDYLYDVPVELAAFHCGYRADGGEGLTQPTFTELKRPEPPGLLQRLKGAFRRPPERA